MRDSVGIISQDWRPGVNDADIRRRLENLQDTTRTNIQNGNVPQSPYAFGCKLG